MKILKKTVLAGGVVYPAGTPATPDLEALIKPHRWTGEATEAPPVAPTEPGEPPRAGRGSGLDAWAVYANSLGIDIPNDAGRDDVIALVDAHHA